MNVVASVNSQLDSFWGHLEDKPPGLSMRDYLSSGLACNKLY